MSVFWIELHLNCVCIHDELEVSNISLMQWWGVLREAGSAIGAAWSTHLWRWLRISGGCQLLISYSETVFVCEYSISNMISWGFVSKRVTVYINRATWWLKGCLSLFTVRNAVDYLQSRVQETKSVISVTLHILTWCLISIGSLIFCLIKMLVSWLRL